MHLNCVIYIDFFRLKGILFLLLKCHVKLLNSNLYLDVIDLITVNLFGTVCGTSPSIMSISIDTDYIYLLGANGYLLINLTYLLPQIIMTIMCECFRINLGKFNIIKNYYTFAIESSLQEIQFHVWKICQIILFVVSLQILVFLDVMNSTTLVTTLSNNPKMHD